jgi:hypothetical protein
VKPAQPRDAALKLLAGAAAATPSHRGRSSRRTRGLGIKAASCATTVYIGVIMFDAGGGLVHTNHVEVIWQ